MIESASDVTWIGNIVEFSVLVVVGFNPNSSPYPFIYVTEKMLRVKKLKYPSAKHSNLCLVLLKTLPMTKMSIEFLYFLLNS